MLGRICVRTCVGVFGYFCLCMEIFLCLEVFPRIWICFDLLGYVCDCLDAFGYICDGWISLDTFGFVSVSVGTFIYIYRYVYRDIVGCIVLGIYSWGRIYIYINGMYISETAG